MKPSLVALLFIAAAFTFTSCKKETETLALPTISEYAGLQVGKALIYRLDSTVIPAFGTSLNVVSYLAKDSIESTFTDNSGRTSYRIYRYTTDTLQQQPWQYKSTYYITPTEQSLEVIDDNNNRYIKLKAPIRENFMWKGNSYIDTKSINSNVRYLDDWDYIYQNVNAPFTTISGNMDSTITVLQRDEDIPEGDFDPDFYKQHNYSVEVYAKGIGLIYKEFLHYTWQTTPPPSKFEDDSYGIKLNLVSYH